MNTLKFSAALLVLPFAMIGQADPLDTWTWRNPLPTGNTLYGVAYGNGQFVAVGRAGTIVTSTDGVNWVLRQSGAQNDLRGIAYGNGQFVGVGNSIVTSSDGVTWVPSPTPAVMNGVTFGNRQFVAVGRGAIVTSTDGTNWFEHQSGVPDYVSLQTIGYGNGLFVAGGVEGALLTSSDGVTWVQRQVATSNTLSGIAYADGQFVVVGYGLTSGFPDTILISTDGISWEQHAPGTQTGLEAIAYGNNEFLAITFSGDTLTCVDGTNWVQRQSGTFKSGHLRAVAYGKGQFVGVGDWGLIVTTADGVSWVQRQGLTDDLSGMAFGKGQFVAVGGHVNNQSDWEGTVLTSADGVSWVQHESGVPLGCIAYGNGQFIAGGSGGIIATSADGVNWIQRPSGTQKSLCGFAYGNGLWVAVGGDYNFATKQYESALLTSTDGVTWEQRQSGTQSLLNAVAYGNGQFVAVGVQVKDVQNQLEKSSIVTSADGMTWVQSQSGTQARELNGIAYGNRHFVAFGQSFEILTSNDGLNWMPDSWGYDPCSFGGGLAYGNGYFVVVRNDGCDPPLAARSFIVASVDGVNWGGGRVGHVLSGVAYGNSRFVAFGLYGAILQSGSIITLAITPKSATGLLSLSLEGPSGLNYTIQSSTDLISWRNLTNITAAQDGTARLDALPAASQRLFYRAYSQ